MSELQRPQRSELQRSKAIDPSASPEFDAFAEDYDAALQRGLAVSGENKDYFAERRVAWLGQHLQRENVKPQSILDFGCGTGSATPYLLQLPGAESLVGVDISPKSISVARRTCGSEQTRFFCTEEFTERGGFDLAYCNGVFHHIPVAQRPEALRFIYEALKPGALFALWENNPWNPGARIVMKRCPFDRDAITLTPPETRRLVAAAGFLVVATEFLFIFPRALGSLRFTEPYLARLPLGAQYQVLCRKPLHSP